MASAVLLIQALGGGWDRSTLPDRPECCGRLPVGNAEVIDPSGKQYRQQSDASMSRGSEFRGIRTPHRFFRAPQKATPKVEEDRDEAAGTPVIVCDLLESLCNELRVTNCGRRCHSRMSLT